ncbi:hypothetical protein EYF80_042763 [Liparis tanakae]|uniref:Uncharacterized protein n=1 Tax=Liparis tanakae TaxID=230148 RepID=A0A4Z2G1J3_9TELE|nr:hypothetical protein EYF80_042763 [Liparis tanakae]
MISQCHTESPSNQSASSAILSALEAGPSGAGRRASSSHAGTISARVAVTAELPLHTARLRVGDRTRDGQTSARPGRYRQCGP